MGRPALLHLAVALDGAGWHPAAWREPDARPQRLFTAGYWTELAQQAERGLLDFLTIEDGLDLQSDDRLAADSRTDRVRGRLDAVLIAARVAAATRHIGFVPTAITTHTEPFHLSKAIATLDYVISGRAGIRVQVAARAGTAAHFGRREIQPLQADHLADPDVQQLIAGHFDEAADYVEVLRRLWDSWEDDAEIRDVATGRFIDRDKLHYIDFEGRWFSVKGPSITPRPPQGQPVVAALGHASVPYRLIARSADVGFVTLRDAAHAAEIVAQIRAAQASTGQTVHVFGDLGRGLPALAADCRHARVHQPSCVGQRAYGRGPGCFADHVRDIETVAYIGSDPGTDDQHVVHWPPGTEYLRSQITPTSLAAPPRSGRRLVCVYKYFSCVFNN